MPPSARLPCRPPVAHVTALGWLAAFMLMAAYPGAAPAQTPPPPVHTLPANQVSPDSGFQDPVVVAERAAAFLIQQAAAMPGIPSATVDASRVAQQPSCDDLSLFLPSGLRLRARMSVGVRCVAPEPWTAYVQAELRVDGHYFVSNRSIEVGERLSLDDLVAREGDLLRLGPTVVADASQIIDHLASQRIMQGTPIKSTALRHPDAVLRGQPVRTVVEGPGFVATGEGRALQTGSPGSRIQVRASSGQILSGTVVNATTVRMSP